MSEEAIATSQAAESQAPMATPDSAVSSADSSSSTTATDSQGLPVNDNKSTGESADATSTTTPEPDAKKDEGFPDWFMRDKFTSEMEQAKAYPELLKKVGKNWGAPKDDYSLDGIEGIAKEDALLPHLKPVLKGLGLSQDGFSELVKGYTEAQVAMGKQMEEQLKTELTQREAQTVQDVDRWLKDTFSEEDRQTVQSWIVSIKDFQLLNTLRVHMAPTTNVPSSTSSAAGHETVAQVENEKVKYRKEVAGGHRVADKNFEDELQARWRDAYQRNATPQK